MPPAPVPADIDEFLRRPNPAVVASLRRDGSPHTVATWYDWDDNWVLLNMDESRLRLRFMQHDPRVAVTVLAEDGWHRHVSLLGRIVSLEASQLRWQPRGSSTVESLQVARVVNCTGPSGNPVGAGEPLLDRLLAAGRIRPDPCRIGIDVDAECRAQSADGSASETLRVVGPLTKGAFWEIVAVPDIRGQVRDLALSL